MGSDHPRPAITRGLVAAALYNIVAFLVFAKFLTNDSLEALEPQVFSDLGWISIVLWGLAYLAVAKAYHRVPALLLVFFAEKMVYAAMWVLWLVRHGASLPEILRSDAMSGVLLSTYGGGDFLFGLFFLWAASQARKLRGPQGWTPDA